MFSRTAVAGPLVVVSVAFFAIAAVAASSAFSKPADYTVAIAGASSLNQGASGDLELTIEPGPGKRLSSDGPVKVALVVSPQKGLKLDRSRFRRKHARDPRARALLFSTNMTADAGGDYQVTIDARFWICGKKTCRPVRERKSVSIAVAGESGQDTGPDAGPDGS